MTALQNDLLRRGPFAIQFRELAILGECTGYYRFTPATIKHFRARYPEQPIRIDSCAYVIETSNTEGSRVTYLIQFDILDPRKSVVIEKGTAVKRVWKGLFRQALDLEKDMFNKGLI